MKLVDAINGGKLPKINKSEMIRICNSIGINVTKENYNDLDLTSEQLSRLFYSKDLHLLSVASSVANIHTDTQKKYQGMIDKYRALSDRMKGKSEFAEDKAVIDGMISDLVDAQKSYAQVATNMRVRGRSVANFDAYNSKEYDPTVNVIDRFRVDNLDKKLEHRENKLNKEYQKLDELIASQSKWKSKFKKKKIQARISKVQQHINELQAKQGKLETKQQRIINKNSDKYLKTKLKEISKYTKQIDREIAFNERKNANLTEQNEYINDIEETKKQIENMKLETGIKASIERGKLKRDKRQMQAQLNSLKRKQGKANLSNQISRAVDNVRGL